MSYIALALLLLAALTAVKISGILKIQPILIQFIFFLAVIFLANHYQYNIPIDLQEIKLIFILSMCYLMSHILHESVAITPDREILVFSFASFIVPFASGMTVAYLLLSHSSAVIMGLIYSVVAVPVLYIYLKELNYSEEKLNIYLQSAVAIDLVAWIVFAFLDPKGSWYYLVLCGLLGGIPLLFKSIRYKNELSSFIFMVLFIWLEYHKLNALLFAIVYLLSMRFTGAQLLILRDYAGKQEILKSIVVPVIIIYGLLQINFSNVSLELNWTFIFALVVFPFVSKSLGSGLAFIATGKKPDMFDAMVLSTRGLTEIVFLNMAKQAGFLSDNHYFYLILMSLFSTIIPGILIQYKKHENNT